MDWTWTDRRTVMSTNNLELTFSTSVCDFRHVILTKFHRELSFIERDWGFVTSPRHFYLLFQRSKGATAVCPRKGSQLRSLEPCDRAFVLWMFTGMDFTSL